MKYYSKTTMQKWTKEELVEYIECLQHNLKCEENLNNHMFNTIMAVCRKDPVFSKAIWEVLEVWNKSYGHRYEEVK